MTDWASYTIAFRPYKRRDGTYMLYINRSNGVTVALSERPWAPYGRDATAGRRNAMDAALRLFATNATPFTGDLAAHTEVPPAQCGPFVLAITDVAEIGGMSLGEDGAYLVADGRILRCGTYDEVNNERVLED